MPTNLAHQGERVFNFVHHVRILVHDTDEMVQYMEQNFAMTPVKVQVYESRDMKNAIYAERGSAPNCNHTTASGPPVAKAVWISYTQSTHGLG